MRCIDCFDSSIPGGHSPSGSEIFSGFTAKHQLPIQAIVVVTATLYDMIGFCDFVINNNQHEQA